MLTKFDAGERKRVLPKGLPPKIADRVSFATSGIKTANQIATNIPTRENIPGQISAHMRQFWTSEMLQTLREIAAETLDILSEEVHSALQSL